MRNYDLDFLKRFSMVIAFLMALTLGLILFAAYLHNELPGQANPVEVARTAGQETVLKQGVKPGETVVTDGQLRLVPGSRITIKGGNPEKADS